MTHTGKLLRSSMVKTFLQKVLTTLSAGSALAILNNGNVMVALPQEAQERFEQQPEGDACVTLGSRQNLSLAAFSDQSNLADHLALSTYTLDQLIGMDVARRSIADEALNKYRELALLHRSVPRFNTSLRLHDVVRALLNECRRDSHPGEMGVIYLLDPKKDTPIVSRFFGFPDESVLQDIATTPLISDVLTKGRPEIVNELQSDPRWTVSDEAMASLLAVPVVSPNRCEGLLVLASCNPGVFEAAHQQHLSTMASVAGISVSNAIHFEETRVLMDAILQALAEAIDSRDPFTAGHSRRVAQLAAAFAGAISADTNMFADVSFSENELREIYYAGILHDVGKIGIREEVLTKDCRLPEKTLDIIRTRMELVSNPDFDKEEVFSKLKKLNKAMTPSEEELELVNALREFDCSANGHSMPLLYSDECACLSLPYGNLTREERDEIERHSAESERILQHIPVGKEFSNLLTIIRQHHERMDGSGYPDKLSGKQLLIQSRLMAIVDIYDAVTQERHYKPALSTKEALGIIDKEAEAGKLDSRLALYFSSNIAAIERQADTFRGGRSFLYDTNAI